MNVLLQERAKAPPPTTEKLKTALAWCWLFMPLLWMWPNARSASEVVVSALLLMCALLSRITTRLVTVLLLVVGLCFLGYFFAVHSLPDEFFWQSILGSNAGEAVEYVQSYRAADAALLLAWALPALLAIRHLWRLPRPLQSKKILVLAWVTLGIWAIWICVSFFKGYDVYKFFSRAGRIYPFMMVESWERYEKNAQLATLTTPATPPEAPPMVDMLVVVIGESASAHRWSLLGYEGNPTNAALAPWQSALVTFPLTTNGNNTGKTLPVIVAGRSLHPLPEQGIASYIDLAKAAGFQTKVFANQQAPGFANVALRLRSDLYRHLQDGKFDGALTPWLQESLQQYASNAQPQIVTLHTYGSHPRVARRYPESAALWSDPYDNSMHYTSQLLAEWIQALDQLQDRRVALLYVSDHGQDFPVCGGSYVHGITRSTYEVPFLLWANQTMRQQYPAWWQQWQQLAQHALDAQGVPRFNTLLPAQLIAQLTGHPYTLPSSQGLSTNGAYPPAETSALCSNWLPHVQQLHPAAVQ